MDESASIDHVFEVGRQYETYLELAQLASLTGHLQDRPQFYAPQPAPLTVTIVSQ